MSQTNELFQEGRLIAERVERKWEGFNRNRGETCQISNREM